MLVTLLAEVNQSNVWAKWPQHEHRMMNPEPGNQSVLLYLSSNIRSEIIALVRDNVVEDMISRVTKQHTSLS